MQLHRFAALFLGLLAPVTFAQASTQRITVSVAGQRTLEFAQLERVAVGDAAIADVRTLGDDQLVLIGASVGHTTLRVWTRGAAAPASWDIVVVPSAAGATAAPVAPVDSTPPVAWTGTLRVGQRSTRSAPGLARIAVGDADIADLATTATGVTLIARKPGHTTVLAWFSDGRREQWDVTVVR